MKIIDKIKAFFLKLNREELVIGEAAALAMLLLPHGMWWKIVLASPIIAVLWASAGAGYGRWLRFVGVPLVAYIALKHTVAYAVGCVAVGALLSVGYGIPSAQPVDPGSALGAFWFRIVRVYGKFKAGNDATVANILTRGTIYGGIILVMFLASLLSGCATVKKAGVCTPPHAVAEATDCNGVVHRFDSTR